VNKFSKILPIPDFVKILSGVKFVDAGRYGEVTRRFVWQFFFGKEQITVSNLKV
jgi:hypothetical protein